MQHRRMQESATLMMVVGGQWSRKREGDAEENGAERRMDWGSAHGLTQEVAFPFKSPIPHRYAELMQDLLRQWGTLLSCAVCAASKPAL
uniref:Uncharacterized protein n=1 Tax=Knipowitschia caucasica TaxID=637954 RepID=A0AAV2LY91_KNICA